MIGPTAEDLEDKEDHAVTAEGLKEIIESTASITGSVSKRHNNTILWP